MDNIFCNYSIIIYIKYNNYFIGSGYSGQCKENEITDVKKQIQDLQAKGKNLSKQDIMSFADLESAELLKNFELLGKMTPDMALTGLKFNKRNKKLYIEGISVYTKMKKSMRLYMII